MHRGKTVKIEHKEEMAICKKTRSSHGDMVVLDDQLLDVWTVSAAFTFFCAL